MSDLTLTIGDTRILTIAVTDESGAPLDITGSHLWWTAKRSRTDADALAVLAKESGAGITTTDGPGGEASISLDAADWSGFVREPTRFVWDLQERTVAGIVTTLDSGWLVVAPDVTQDVTP